MEEGSSCATDQEWHMCRRRCSPQAVDELHTWQGIGRWPCRANKPIHDNHMWGKLDNLVDAKQWCRIRNAVIAFQFQYLLIHFQDGRIVVDDENSRGHSSPPVRLLSTAYVVPDLEYVMKRFSRSILYAIIAGNMPPTSTEMVAGIGC